MFVYEKKLQYPVKITTPNPKLAAAIISQYGGPDGELGASLRYLSQRYSMPYPELKGLLTDIGTEEASWPNFGAVFFQSVQHIDPFGGQQIQRHLYPAVPVHGHLLEEMTVKVVVRRASADDARDGGANVRL